MNESDKRAQAAPGGAGEGGEKVRKIFGAHPLKMVFALEYVLQGLANPFQGVTYQPFFRHFRIDYGLSEAATQNLFARSYLAWSFKPVLGFLIDAYGKTKVILTALLAASVLGFLLTPIVDTSAMVFFGFMFGLSIILAATDVSVDRATVIAGDEEARSTGRSKSTTVGLNQAICWSAIYGTGILAAILGGWTADHVPFDRLMIALAIVPALVLVVVLLLPKDREVSIPLKRSVQEFWRGLNSGPILGVMLFYFIFHFQPAMGALWTNYQLESLGFSQTQTGIADGAAYFGYFLGVLLFAWKGVVWQDRLGLRAIFRIFIVASVAINLTQYLLVDPWFTAITRGIHGTLPFIPEETVRLGWLCAYNIFQSIGISLIRMSTFSLVGAVIPVAAAGSLFAGFMSVSNLAYSFCYSSGAWLYDNGMRFGFMRAVQESVFRIPGQSGDELSINMLILIGSFAYLLSFATVHLLPDRRQTLVTEVDESQLTGPERWNVISSGLRTAINLAALVGGVGLSLTAVFAWGVDPIAATILGFFCLAFLRKVVLDDLLRRHRARSGGE